MKASKRARDFQVRNFPGDREAVFWGMATALNRARAACLSHLRFRAELEKAVL